jgi:hypothetical protein
MTEKAIDSSAGGCLILIFPIALLIIFLFKTWPVLLALLVLSATWNVWQRYQWQKWSQQVNPIFHKLIQENRGSITALDLSMNANLSAATAKRYLDTKAEEFGAQRRDLEDQGTVYYFITASTLGSIFDDSEPLRQPKISPVASEAPQLLEPVDQEQQRQTESPREAADEQLSSTNHTQSVPESLIQSELAKRLDVHSSTIYKRRDDPDFSEWSRSRDPEGIAWQYSPETKDFSPLEEEKQE